MQITLELSDNTEQSLKQPAEMVGMSVADHIQTIIENGAERGYSRLIDARQKAAAFKRFIESQRELGIPVVPDEAMSRRNLIRDIE